MVLIVQDARVTAAPPEAIQRLFAEPGVFETMRVDRLSASPNVVSLFRSSHHIERLLRSAEACGYIAPDPVDVMAAVDEGLKALSWGQISAARLRIFAHPTSWCVVVSDLGELLPATGARIVSIPVQRELPEHKRCPAPVSVSARAAARARGADEALLIGASRVVLEGAWSSFLWFDTKGVLHRPHTGVLDGITSRAVLDCEEERLGPLRAEPYVVQDVVDFEVMGGQIAEAFLTNALNGIVPVLSIDGVSIGTGQRGVRTARLQQRFLEYRYQRMEQIAVPRGSVTRKIGPSRGHLKNTF